ncbi:MAG TPA: hypothetical protein DGH68_06970, partial [Bacteroidetes bacterium]|nr:hypothetical protein [Bacteroidota bacterium]
VTAILGFANPNRSWIWALSVGVWIPIGNIALYNNYESIPALVLAFIGAFGGAFARRLVSSRP